MKYIINSFHAVILHKALNFKVRLLLSRRKAREMPGLVVLMAIIIIIAQSGCKKFVLADPPSDRMTQENVYADDLTATSVLTNIYGKMTTQGAAMAKYTGLSSDEFDLSEGSTLGYAALAAYHTNTLVSNQSSNSGLEIWNEYYSLIFTCNSAIEGVSAANTLTAAVKKQLLGESYFLRAWFYFYLINLYGDVPMVLGTDPEINRLLPRSPKQLVYQQMVNDLKEAQNNLSEVYLNGLLKPYTGLVERTRPTKWAATALLSRVYLYMKEYGQAEFEASKLIQNASLFELQPIDGIFLKDSGEAIWQLQPVTLSWNTNDGHMFNLNEPPSGFSEDKPVYMSDYLLNAFESGDNRHTLWINSYNSGGDIYYFPYKYKVGSEDPNVVSTDQMLEYIMALRISEQYLIRAEARARLSNISGAQDDLDAIRNRAGLSNTIANDEAGLLEAILKERQIELFSEWGNRWFDLKRTGKTDAVMQTVTSTKGGNWESTDQLYPIPYNDLLYNPRLTQNAGY